jgi:hypothetical protein
MVTPSDRDLLSRFAERVRTSYLARNILQEGVAACYNLYAIQIQHSTNQLFSQTLAWDW